MRTIADDTRVNMLREQFIPDHVFIYIVKGTIRVYDGTQSYTYRAGDACLARKNRLAKYELLDSKERFEPIIFCFDQPFLQDFQSKHRSKQTTRGLKDTIIDIQSTELIQSFIQSIKPYYKGVMQLDEAFEDLKYEELLIILLKTRPELAAVLFEFRRPGKIDLEEFMNSNYKFNVNVERFAYLTGRSISAFKRDFAAAYHETPGHWLVKRRLQEAHFLISQENKKPSDVYLDLGFEDLSHFSFAFKKQFGIAPTQLAGRR
ncbi:AraC family transcriptional regulator [Dyadobacter sp. CY345]|uniref:AraC family transcriptional regulator n=1 Tax=Dyadobacter sp. CY345 TaxID=2909335 RepID=UPI001F41E0B8|nr:AraC family transcriptional regulator [Dyadobacter sp. CY345]MCF2446775.1 AraC family transcriptional regulator [Dyadobacter sp. CY345]